MPDADEISGHGNGNVVPTPLTSETHHHVVPIETAIDLVGTGAFQRQILLAAGLCFMADAMEVLLLSFLSTVLKHEWNLSEGEVDSIVAVVFAGALLGTLLLGRAGDVFGRKPVFAVTAFVIAIAGVVTAFCQNYEQLLLARFWVGFGVGGLIVPFDTLGEFLPSAARGKNLLYIGR
jgi:MFS family permease